MTQPKRFSVVPQPERTTPAPKTPEDVAADVQRYIDASAEALQAARDALRTLVEMVQQPFAAPRDARFPTQLFDMQQVADMLGVSRSKVKGLVVSGELRSQQIGSLRRVSSAAIEDYLAQTTVHFDTAGSL